MRLPCGRFIVRKDAAATLIKLELSETANKIVSEWVPPVWLHERERLTDSGRHLGSGWPLPPSEALPMRLNSFSHLEIGGAPMLNSGNAVTRVELYDVVYRRVGLSRSESASLVELVLTEITDSIARGETVKLSSFGTFTVRKKAKRMGRNPKTGIAAPIPPRRVVIFKASAVMKQRINANRLQEQSEKTLTETDMKGAALT
jgi:integration host factor subunit alpha